LAQAIFAPSQVRGLAGKEDSHTMSTIFARGFDYGTDEEALKKHFSAVGAIKEMHLQSRGAAVVVYEKASAASRAVNELHETTMEGQSRYVAVKLDEHRDLDKGKGKGSVNGSGRGGGDASGRIIFVTGFDFDTDDAALEWHFGKMGAIETLHFQSRTSAVITFVKASNAQRALTTIDGTTMSGQSRHVTVKLDDPDRKGKGKGGKGSGKGAGKAWVESGGGDTGRAIHVSGFDRDTDEAVLNEHFGIVGAIETLHFQSKGAAVITFVEADAAQHALTELAGTTMRGQSRYVAVKLDNASRRAGGKGEGEGERQSRE